MINSRDRFWATLCAAVLACALLSGCDGPGKPNPANRFVHPDQVLDFSALFRKNCSGCHGSEGKGGPAPPLNDPLFLSIATEADLRRPIVAGRAGTLMPSFAKENGGTLTIKQVDAIVQGIQSWAKPTQASFEVVPLYQQPALSDASKSADLQPGLRLYARACAQCHGDSGQGTKTAGALNDRAFLSLISNQALRRIIITGRPDLGMPNYRDGQGRPEKFSALTDNEVDQLVELLNAWRGPVTQRAAASQARTNTNSTTNRVD